LDYICGNHRDWAEAVDTDSDDDYIDDTDTGGRAVESVDDGDGRLIHQRP
jgi:hypothetical protein